MKKEYTHLLDKYETELDKNPRSKCFAPLAEIYRKMGMHHEALAVLKQGIRNHPEDELGFLGLAFCYFDLGELKMAHAAIKPFAHKNKDNFRFQNLYGKICLKLKLYNEALETYKYLLFLNPKDKNLAAEVYFLENELGQKDFFQNKPESNNQALASFPDFETKEIDEWVKKDLFSKSSLDNEKIDIKQNLVNQYLDQGDISSAQDILQKILTIDSENHFAQQKLSEISRTSLSSPTVVCDRLRQFERKLKEKGESFLRANL